MAIKPLATMPLAGLLDGTELFYAQQAGNDVKVLSSQFITYGTYLDIPSARDGTPYVNLVDMCAAIQAAIDATPAHGNLFIPPGTYKLIGTGTTCLTISKPIRLVGVGLPLLVIDSTVPATRNIITVTPVGNTYGWEFGGIQFQGMGGGFYGKHIFNIDLTSGTATFYNVFFHDLVCNPTSAGNSIFVSNVNTNGGFFNSTFDRCFLESAQLLNVGDNIEINRCTFNSTVNTAIIFYQVSGAGNFKIIGNALASNGGAIIAESGISNIIRDNEIETPAGTNLLGFLIIINSAGGPQDGCQIVNNQIQVLSGTGNPVPISITTTAVNCLVQGGRISVISGPHIAVGSANSTKIDQNSIEAVVNGVVAVGLTITDAGTNTNLFPIITPSGTVANLPAAAAALTGAKSYVTNANATLTAGIGAVVAGGGANTVPVFCDGANWRIG